MAITSAAAVGTQGPLATVKAVSERRIQITLDATYPTGGYAAFVATTVKGITGFEYVTVLGVKQESPAGGYLLFWDRANDKLMVYQYPTALGPATQVPNLTNLSTVVAAELTVTFT
uniref:Uncharacterized protein n=1 Tax=viral metagenome TaxID=1070528 RepID=A0A6M3XV64_9ZZZZ